ncbi:MAG: hypothetical protein ACTHXA_04330 [Gulosibacter sp.]
MHPGITSLEVRGRRRFASLTLGLVAAVLVLTGCSLVEPSSPWEVVAEDQPFFELNELPNGFEGTTIERTDDNRVDIPGSTIRVTKITESDSLSRDAAIKVNTRIPASEERLPNEEIAAPNGEVFHAVRLDVQSNYWLGADSSQLARPQFSVLFSDREQESFLIEWMQGESILLFSASADAHPTDAVLQIEASGSTQQLSLIDGSRVDSDIEHFYAAANEVAINEQDSLSERATDETGDTDAIYIGIDDAHLTPMTAEYGWADEGNMYLAVNFNYNQHFTSSRVSTGMDALPFGSGTTFQLRLPDGTVLDAIDTVSTYGVGQLAWFEIPSTTTAAEFITTIDPYPRREGFAEDFANLEFVSPLTLTHDNTR